MQSFDRDLIHFISDRVIPVSGQAVNTGPDEEMRSDVLRRAKQLIDVALPIADVDTPRRIIEQLGGLPEVFQPPEALLLFDRHPRRVDLLLESSSALEFLPESRI